MTSSSTPAKVVGQSVERIEDPPLVTGRGRLEPAGKTAD